MAPNPAKRETGKEPDWPAWITTSARPHSLEVKASHWPSGENAGFVYGMVCS